MKKTLYLMLVNTLTLLLLSCTKDDGAGRGTTSYTFTLYDDYEVEIDVILFEYNEINERINNNTIDSAKKGVPYTYTARDNAVKVKVHLSFLGANRWVQQVYYLVEGENIDIGITDNTIIGNIEP